MFDYFSFIFVDNLSNDAFMPFTVVDGVSICGIYFGKTLIHLKHA